MTDTAERIAKLAERLDPRPPDRPIQDWGEWMARDYARFQLAVCATPGAQLGALVDLLAFKYSTAKMLVMLHEATAKAMLGDGDILAALLAVMEEVEI